ncbi:MAG TPA: glycoside hydrolase family 30 beta sandwich domain-containing protein [Saprospiraceae bacterium]|nr:glycoside hydrolase family 30 beta sandwich domain-containing protein [Saprospiraceae bacterium]
MHPTGLKSFILMPQVWFLLLLFHAWGCKPKMEDEWPAPTPVFPVQVWTTSGNGVNLLYGKTIDFAEGKDDRLSTIQIDTTQRFQTVEGFGYTLTGGSAQLLHLMGAAERNLILKEMFGNASQGNAVSYLRISLGASDLDPEVFSYNDLPSGQTDPELLKFNLSRDTLHLIPVLKEILAINPKITLMASPWSPPKWMKTNNSSVGGNLKPEYYSVYARYFVKYIQAMSAQGIKIQAVTPQNEPQHGGNNPSLVMSFLQQADFIKNHLGPAFQQAGLDTKIIIWDHNCDNAAYPIAILDDPAAKPFVHGSAFHLYAGDVSALTEVHNAHPDKGLYFTEQWTGANSQFDDDLKWHMKNVIIGTMRNWSRVVLEWNLANDPNYEPHTPGGCSQCKGALTIDGSKVNKNVSYYIVAQASRFVPPGSVRVFSNLLTELPNVAFLTPEGKYVLIVLNESSQLKTFNIQAGGRWITGSLYGDTVATFVW